MTPTINRLVPTRPKQGERQFFVVGKLRELLKPSTTVRINKYKNFDQAFDDATSKPSRPTTWISISSKMTDQLLQAASRLENPRRLGDLFMIQSPRLEALPAIHGYFERVSGQVSGYRSLAPGELAEVLKSPSEEARDLFIGGCYDATTGTLSLTRGDFDMLVVPESIFKPSGTALPNFSALAFTDHGHTIRLGPYEASSDSILYEVDADYRKRLNKKRRATDKGFGPSLRRLRIQKGLGRGDFPRLAAKTIARIERGETEKPRGATLAVIARTLGVEPDQIESY